MSEAFDLFLTQILQDFDPDMSVEQQPAAAGIPIARDDRRLDDGVDAVRAALELTEAALLEVARALEPGRTETEIAAALEHACRRRGACITGSACPF